MLDHAPAHVVQHGWVPISWFDVFCLSETVDDKITLQRGSVWADLSLLDFDIQIWTLGLGVLVSSRCGLSLRVAIQVPTHLANGRVGQQKFEASPGYGASAGHFQSGIAVSRGGTLFAALSFRFREEKRC